MLKFLSLLAVVANGDINATTLSQEELAAIAAENEQKLIWIIAMLVILLGVLYFTFIHSKLREKIKEKKSNRVEAKAEKKKNEDLERLHKIKEKNKRK